MAEISQYTVVPASQPTWLNGAHMVFVWYDIWDLVGSGEQHGLQAGPIMKLVEPRF